MHHPLHRYRSDFRRLVLQDRPATALEVGSGSGALLRKLAASGVAAEGVEANIAHVEQLRTAGHLAHQATDEVLPFADNSFDVVVSEYCAHHFADLAKHLSEALRVARRAVWLLDCWYDMSFESQRLMRIWDSWFKQIDRREGRVHNETLQAGEIVAAMPGVSIDRIEIQHSLRLAAVDVEWFDAESAEHVERATPAEAEQLAQIRADLLKNGMTDDGAIMVRVAAGDGGQA